MTSWQRWLCAMWLLVPALAQGWGAQGHRLVGEYAQARLQPAAQAEVRRLLQAEAQPSLAGVSVWADEIRDTPEGKRTARWHFINYEPGSCHFRAEQLCPDGDCLVAAIETQLQRLGNRSLPQAERAEALKYLVHFIADAHQPLHAGYFADRGGNRFQISYQREGWNLHSVWDSLILRSGEHSQAQYLAMMAAALPAPPAAAGAAGWTEESCALVQQPGFYPPDHKITRAYLDANRSLALRQLAIAGERLAGLLNEVLGEP